MHIKLLVQYLKRNNEPLIVRLKNCQNPENSILDSDFLCEMDDEYIKCSDPLRVVIGLFIIIASVMTHNTVMYICFL